MPYTTISIHDSRDILINILKGRWHNIFQLIKNGFAIDTDIKTNKSVLCYAVETGQIIHVETILQFKPDVKNKSNINSLIFAYRSEVPDNIMSSLIKYGFNLNCTYLSTYEAFNFALENNNYLFCEEFLKNLSSIQEFSIKYPYIIHAALQKGFSKIALKFLNLGWNVRVQDQSGKTPLHYAFQYHDLTASEIFREDFDDENDLFSAVTPIHKEIINILMNHSDIDLSAVDYEGNTCVNYLINDKSIFLCYSEEKKIKFVKFFLKRGVDINAQNGTGVPLLHEAAKYGYEKIVAFLLAHGANVKAVDRYGQTALHLALDYYKFKVADIFLSNEIEIKSKNKSNQSLFFSACRVRHKKAVIKLLELNVNVNQTENNNESALNAVISNARENDESVEIVKKLLDYKANVNCTDEHGRTPLHNILLNQSFKRVEKFQELTDENLILILPVTQMKIIKMLIEHPDIDFAIADCSNQTIMNCLLQNMFWPNSEETKIEIIKLSLKNGMNINAKNGHLPIIHEAIKSGSEKIVKFLLDHGVDINTVDKFRQTAVHFALDQCKYNMVNMFLNYEIDLNSKNLNGESMLFTAIRVRHDKAVKRFLELKANLNVIENGKTPLHAACSISHESDSSVRIVEHLLNYKINVNWFDSCGRTPLHYACKCSSARIVKLLLSHRAEVNVKDKKGKTPLCKAIVKKHSEIIKLLLCYGANVNEYNADYSSPLFLALGLIRSESDFEAPYGTICTLLEYGADINFQDKSGRTPLHIACQLGKGCLSSKLLRYSPDFNITDETGFTPLSMVIRNLDSWHERDDMDDLDYIVYSAMFRELLTYMIRMRAANAYISPKNLQIMKPEDIWQFDINFDDPDFWNRIYEKCKNELMGLKRKIPGTVISYYDILTKDVEETAPYLPNDVEWLEHEDYENYFDIIDHKMTRMFARKGLLRKSYAVFNFLFRNSPNLPILCTEQICSYLKDNDLRNILIVLNDISSFVDFKGEDGIEKVFYDTLNHKIRGVAVNNLPEKCYKIFNFVFTNFSEVPSNCIKNICSYLNDNDIRNLLNLRRSLM